MGGMRRIKKKGGMKDDITHSNVNDHLRELNSGASANDDDTDKMEKYPPPHKKKSRKSKKRGNDRKKKERYRSHSTDPESSPSILKEGQLLATSKAANTSAPTATKRTTYDHKKK